MNEWKEGRKEERKKERKQYNKEKKDFQWIDMRTIEKQSTLKKFVKQTKKICDDINKISFTDNAYKSKLKCISELTKNHFNANPLKNVPTFGISIVNNSKSK